MHRQVSAERSKRAEILESEGQRQSAINIAEGEKQSTILASEAIRAENINRASGEAEAILLRAKATAEGLQLVAKAIESDGGQEAVGMGIAEKYVEAFGRLAKEGNSVVVPAGLGDMGGMIAQVYPYFKICLTVGIVDLQQGKRFSEFSKVKTAKISCWGDCSTGAGRK
jgi:regulator of protease activity HflC (stomatin/prohibitin superfamily)